MCLTILPPEDMAAMTLRLSDFHAVFMKASKAPHKSHSLEARGEPKLGGFGLIGR